MVNKSKLKGKFSTGRIIVFSLFAVFYVYATSAVLGSIIRDIYGNQTAPDADVSREDKQAWCARRLTVLRRELDERVAQTLHYDGDNDASGARWHDWLAAWKARVADGARVCKDGAKPVQRAFTVLQRMGDNYDDDLRGLRKTETKLARQFDEALQKISDD